MRRRFGWRLTGPDGEHPRRPVVSAASRSLEFLSTIVAQVAEVSVGGGRIKVEKVTCAVDCGVAVNPDQVLRKWKAASGSGSARSSNRR